MWFVSFVWRNIWRRPTRSLLTAFGLAIAVAAVVSLVGISFGFERSFSDLYAQRGVDILIQRKGGAQAMNKGLPMAMREDIAKIDGVEDITATLVDMISFPEANLFTVIIDGWPPDSSLFRDLKIVSGRELKADDKKRVMLGRKLAANLGKKVGDTVKLYEEDFEVIGIFEDPNVFVNNQPVVLLDELQRMMDRPDQISGFAIHAKSRDPATLAAMKQQLETILPSTHVNPTSDFIGNLEQLRVAQAVAWLTSAIALIIGAVGMLNTMVMSVYERSREIGTLRAMGWRKRRVVRMVLGEALLLSLAGAVLGVGMAILMARGLSSLPMTSGLIDGRIAPWVIGVGFLVAVVVGVLGAAYPAYWGASLPPVVALRKK